MLMTLILPINVSGAGDFNVTHSFSSNPAEQGDVETITISITNNNPDQCRITWLGIHFDWQAEDIYFICDDVSEENPESIATGETESFGIIFEIPSNVQTGTHTYDIRFYYDLHDGWFGEWNSYTWQSVTLTDFRVEERDSDDDGVPDSLDTYPNDPTRWEQENNGNKDNNSSSNSLDYMLFVWIGIITIVIIIIVVVIYFGTKKKQSPQYPPQQYPPPQQPPQAQPVHPPQPPPQY